jgi:hypothetical protein
LQSPGLLDSTGRGDKNEPMEALEFKEQNRVFATTQDEYNDLPAHVVNEPEGRVIFCMGLTFKERLRILVFGKLWVSLMMFGKPLTPSHFTTKKSDYFIKQ